MDLGLGPHVVPRVGVIVAHVAHIVLDAVARQRGVHVPAQPVGEAVARHQFHTHAVTVGDVLCHQFADLVDFAVEHQLVLVLHVVEVDPGGETAAAQFVAGLPVIEFLARGMLHQRTVVVVVARGLLLGHGKRGIEAVVLVHLPVQTRLGVEEVKRLVDVQHLQVLGAGGPVPLVVIAPHAIADVAVLQVGIGAQATRNHVVTLDVDVEVVLAGIVAVILVVGCQRTGVVLDPDDLAVVVVSVAVDAATQCGCQALAGVLQREHPAAKAAVQAFLAHQARLLARALGRHHGLQAILLERARVLVFLVVAVAVGIVQRHVEFPLGVERLVPDQLVVGLAVDIFLVLVEARHLAVVLDFAVGVIGAVVLQVVAADAVPGVVGVFLAAEGDETQRRAAAEVAQLAIVTQQFAARAVTVAVTADVRQARLYRPVVPQQATAHTQCFLVGVERAVTARHLGKSIA